MTLASLPSCLQGAPAATPPAAGVRGAAGGAGIAHLAALWGIAGVGGTGDSGEPDVEEAKATVEMLLSRSLLQQRAPPPRLAGSGMGEGHSSFAGPPALPTFRTMSTAASSSELDESTNDRELTRPATGAYSPAAGDEETERCARYW